MKILRPFSQRHARTRASQPARRTARMAVFRARGGFTLLEVMLAVAIIGFTTVGIFRFV